MATSLTLGASGADVNPLLVESTAPHGAPQFTQITNEHYKPAFEQAVREARADIAAIVGNAQAPTFANTIEALEFSGRRLDRISNIFFNLNEAHTNDTMQALALELSPMLTEFSNDVSLDPKLFARVKAVYDRRESLGLNAEQRRLLEKTYKGFARSGAALSDEDKKIYRELTARLSELSLQFNQNSLAATNAFTLHVTDPAVVGELPDFVREGMAAEAKERGLDGWVVTLQIPSMVPFMTYSSNRALKEKLWRAYNTRCVGGEFDNSAIVEEIADKRLQLAGLLGYETYADYVLEERMAESSPTVNAFLAELLDRAVEAARRDVETVAGYARAQGFDAELMPWDFGYYSEKLKHERYELSEELTKPYFQLENVRRGMFELANRLYGITLRENPEIPVYHPDVKAYEVFDADGSFLAVLYMDFFPRASKRGGAWMTEFRQQGVENGVETRPLISVVYNFTKPTDSLPSLLTFDEVTTKAKRSAGFTMTGSATQAIAAAGQTTTVQIALERLVSKVAVQATTDSKFAATYPGRVRIASATVSRAASSVSYFDVGTSHSGGTQNREHSGGTMPLFAAQTFSHTQAAKEQSGKYANLFYIYGNEDNMAAESVLLTLEGIYDHDGDFGTTDDQMPVSYESELAGDSGKAINRNTYRRVTVNISGLTGADVAVTITPADWEGPFNQDVNIGM